MALVLLPCDLPSWPGVQGLLNTIKTVRTSVQLIELMQRIHTMCCISLDPDENDRIHINHFSGLQRFLDEVMSPDERSNFFHVTLPSMATCALQLRHHKPLDGLQYSLQQQADCTHLEWTFVASLLASAFFSMFPKRTVKTHPTLQDFNLSPMFSHLSSSFQQKKLTNIFRYFDRLATLESSKEWKSRGQMVTTRQVMNKKTMLNMDDWMKCDVPLCPLVIKNDGRIGQTDLNDTYQVCFSNIRLGEDVLNGGERQEDDIFCACPELLSVLVSTEALDYNEAFVVHCSSGNSKTSANEFSHICFLDALDFRLDTSAQYKEWPILRELNKCYVGFLQHPSRTRLPPVGKSFSSEPELPPPSVPTSVEVRHKSTPGQVAAVKALKCFSYKGGFGGGGIVNQAFEDRSSKEESSSRSRLQFDREDSEDSLYKDCKDEVKGKARYSCRRPKAVTKCQKGRKSSRLTMGERREGPLLVLPKTSAPADTSLLEVPESPVASGLEDACSMEASFLSCQSRVSSSTSSSVSLNSEDGYVSCAEEADTTLLLLTDPVCGSKASTAVPESSSSGAIPRHKESFHNIPKFPSQSSRPSSPSSSSSQSPSEGEPCSRMTDPFGEESELFPLRRSGSTGFILQGEEAAGEEGVEFDEPDLFPGEGGLEQEREWLNQFRRHRHATYTTQTDSRNSSSRYSFSSDFSSDLEDIYEHFEEKMTEGPVRDNPAYAIYGRHLKRTLSDSLTSIPTCRNYNPGDLESSGKHVPISAQLRSLSLTEKMQIQEKLSVECAKRMIRVSSKDAPDAPTLDNQSRTDVDEPVESKPLPESTVENAVGCCHCSPEFIRSSKCDSFDPDTNSIEELRITLPLPPSSSSRLPTQLSVWWNYNSVYEFWFPLKVTNKERQIPEPPHDANKEIDAPSASQCPPALIWKGIRRCKSSPIVTGPRSTPDKSVRRSRSFKDMIKLANRPQLGTSFTRSISASDEPSCKSSDELSSRLKKWQAALDLSHSWSTESSSVGEELKRRRAQRMETLTEENRASLSSSDRETVAPAPLISGTDSRRDKMTISVVTRPNAPQDQSVSVSKEYLSNESSHCIKAVSTGNWGCGHRQGGDPQLKAIIQWMAASKANVPSLIYYTASDARMVKFNIVCRVLLDRHWTVGHVAKAVQRYSDRRRGWPVKVHGDGSGEEADLFNSLLPKETDL